MAGHDWEAIEAEYRAGQMSVRAIASAHGLSEGAIRKRAKAEGWVRALAEKVRAAVRERLVRADGTQDGTQSQRGPTDQEIIEAGSLRGFDVVQSHRRDLAQLIAMANVLATRLSQHLHGDPLDGPGIGEKESAADMLEKLTRIRAKLIPLERQAFNLDADPTDPVKVKVEADGAFAELVGALERAARARARDPRGAGGVAEQGEA